jgi:uncharacterized membrane protein YjfL (UPF0719 family)
MNIFIFWYLLSVPIGYTDSIIGFFVWIGFSVAVILPLRFCINKLMLIGHDMDRKMVEDENWGVAMMEGASVLMIAMICETFVGPDTANNVVNCKTN